MYIVFKNVTRRRSNYCLYVFPSPNVHNGIMSLNSSEKENVILFWYWCNYTSWWYYHVQVYVHFLYACLQFYSTIHGVSPCYQKYSNLSSINYFSLCFLITTLVLRYNKNVPNFCFHLWNPNFEIINYILHF